MLYTTYTIYYTRPLRYVNRMLRIDKKYDINYR